MFGRKYQVFFTFLQNLISVIIAIHWRTSMTDVKAAAADMRYFARSKFSKSLVHKKNFWLDMTSSLQVRILILSREVGYLFLA